MNYNKMVAVVVRPGGPTQERHALISKLVLQVNTSTSTILVILAEQIAKSALASLANAPLVIQHTLLTGVVSKTVLLVSFPSEMKKTCQLTRLSACRLHTAPTE